MKIDNIENEGGLRVEGEEVRFIWEAEDDWVWVFLWYLKIYKYYYEHTAPHQIRPIHQFIANIPDC